MVAVGDVHGATGPLDALIAHLDALVPTAPIIFLGDLVDRGPNASGAIECVRRIVRYRTGSLTLLGNHDNWLVKAVAGDDEAMGYWLPQGGRETLLSFGVSPDESWSHIRRTMNERHGDLLARIATHPRLALGEGAVEGHVFVHAGIDPYVRLDEQDEDDLIWIREPFLNWPEPLERRVVHGHTIEGRRPVLRAHRIGLDTGAYATGILTAAIFRTGEKPTFVSTKPTGGMFVVEPAKPVVGLF